jgi:hypothetical protein
VRDYPLALGPKLVEVAQNKIGYDHLALDEWLRKTDFPIGGFYVDATTRKVACWGADLNQRYVERIEQLWIGWEVIWLKDNYEYQLEQTRGKLTFPSQSTEELIAEIETELMREAGGLQPFLEFVEMSWQRGDKLLINPDALHDNPQEVALAVRKQIFDDTVSSWKNKR